jgi:hypothetical protein
MKQFTEDDLNDAWDRVGQTPDGRKIRNSLQIIVMTTTARTSDLGALAAFEGRRSLAAELIAKLDQSVGETDVGSPVPESVVVVAGAQRQPVPQRGAQRRR